LLVVGLGVLLLDPLTFGVGLVLLVGVLLVLLRGTRRAGLTGGAATLAARRGLPLGGLLGRAGLAGLAVSSVSVAVAAFGRPLDSPRRSRMAATSSLLRIADAPSTPISLASARSSGRTMLERDAGRAPDAASAGGAVSAVDVPFVPSASARSWEVEISELTVWDCGSSTFSPLPPAVMRSVSVTDFLSIPR
jgi:hypothetical protein